MWSVNNKFVGNILNISQSSFVCPQIVSSIPIKHK